MSRILRFFALVAVVFFSVNAFAGDPYGSCSAKRIYTDCAEGYVLQNDECVLESSGACSAGQYWNGSACTSCPSTHPNSAAGASSESECYKTAELIKNGGSGTCFGKTGTLDGVFTCYYGSTCTLPSWNSSSCNMTNGSKIFKGWSSSDDATTGTTGDFVHGNTYYAVWVTPSCNITNGTGEVISALNNKPRCEVTCDSGYGTSGTYTGSAGGTNITFACTPTSNTCSAGQYWNGSACKECTSGYYCPGGTWTGTAVQGRESCPDGYGNSEPGSVAAADCYLTTTAGKYVATPESAETTCAENGYCPGGIDVYYGDTDGRTACTANSSSDAGSDAISDCKCNAGYGGNAGVTGGTCTICAAGTYKTSSGNTSCSACTAGYYCTGGTNQTACTANSSSAAGSDAISDCKCNAGYGGNAGVTGGTCTICSAGTYKTSSGNTSCSTCTAGYYCTGGTNRTACAANSSSSAGSDAISDCQCNAGYGGNAGVTGGTCTICAAGTYKTGSGNSSCSTCTEGYYCTGGTNNQTACPTGYGNSAPGSDAQSDCYMIVPAGSYLPTGGSTTTYTCPRGSSSGEHEVYYGNISQCSSCAPGSYTPYDGAACAVCLAGYYCTGDGNATRCPALYPNSSAGSDAATDCYTNTLTGQYIATPRAEVVTDCQAGTSAGAHTVYYGETSQCNRCKTNQWSGDAAGSCQTCPSGWANDGETAADHAYISSCKHTVAAGSWYNSDNSTFDTCATGTYSEAHMAGYGVSTSCESCNTGYTNNTDHTACVAVTYTVQYNANGGSGTTASSSHTYGVAKALTANGFTRTGYTFAGWATSSSGAVVYTNQQSVTNLASTQGATVNLYAQWTANTYTCTSGQYLNVTSCETCTAGYYCPSSSATYTYNGSVQGRTPCGAGKYSSAGATSCSNITAGCYGTSASSSCPAVCAANTYSNAGASSCSSCPTDYKNSGDTAASHAGSASCKITVSGGYYIGTAGDNSSNWDKCAGGTYKASHTVAYGSTSSCATCSAGYYCPEGASSQTACGGNTKYSSSGASACSTVSSGYYSTGGTSTTRTGQTKCEAGNYCSGGVKTACGGGKYSSAGATSCSNITAGCYGTSASSSCPAVCAANTYSNAGASACTSCDSDYANSGTDAASHAGVASCKVTCAAGTYVASANAACTDVGSGYYTTASQTISQGSTGSRSACSSLNAFYTASDSGRNATTDCYGTTSSGKYVSTAKSGEVTCAAGGYCAGSVKVYYNSTGGRTACGAGKYNASTGSSASSACTNITAGCYGTSASSSCPAVCAANTYSDAGASSCSSCPTDYKNSGDTAASHAGSASCIITVSGGYYIGTAGDNSSNWDECACGTYKASHTVAYGSTSSCAPTDAGYYAAAGASSQTKATAGYYAAAGACSQTACSGRTKYSAAGAASCSTVLTGYYTTGCNSSSNACTSQTICAKGTYCSSGVAYDCPGGTYGSTTGLSTNACSGKCTAGYYCPAGSTSATQNACATNATSAAGSDAISDCVCKAGYSGDASTSSGTCTACACGYYKGSTGNTSCTKTTAGYYATGTGNTGQTKATAGNYAAAGACSQSSCADLGGGLYSSSAAGSDATNDCYATVPATKYLSSSTSTSFTTCTAGYYCPGKTLYYNSTGGRTGCGAGKYSAAGSGASSDCKTISAGCYGASASSACPNTCAPGNYSTGGTSGCTICANKPTNSSYTDATGNTSADCPWTCNDGYNQTSDNQCGQFCTAGITHIKSSNGLSVPLYSSARTSPAINVQVNDSICYGSLATGQSSGALNVKVGSTTYHAIN